MPLTAIADFAKLGEKDPFFAELAGLTGADGGLWNAAAECFLLEKGKKL
jgi:hypothetical protein